MSTATGRPSREGIQVLAGGGSGQAFARVARYADGYAHGGGLPRAFESAAARPAPRGTTSAARASRCSGVRATSRSATSARGNDYLLDYYAFTGPFAERIVAGNLTSARAIKDFMRGYEEAGCDELVLFRPSPTSPSSTGSTEALS